MEYSKPFEEKFARICQVTHTDKDSALAKILGIKAPSVAAAKKRQQIPTGWVEKIALQYGVSADWIFFGRGPMTIIEAEGVPPDEASRPQPSHIAQRIDLLERELELERCERRELAAENRKLYREKEELHREKEQLLRGKEELLRENGTLREKLARLEAAPGKRCSIQNDDEEDLPSLFDEQRTIRSSSREGANIHK